MLGFMMTIAICPSINTLAAKNNYGNNYVDENGVTHINNVKSFRKNTLPIIKRVKLQTENLYLQRQT